MSTIILELVLLICCIITLMVNYKWFATVKDLKQMQEELLMDMVEIVNKAASRVEAAIESPKIEKDLYYVSCPITEDYDKVYTIDINDGTDSLAFDNTIDCDNTFATVTTTF